MVVKAPRRPRRVDAGRDRRQSEALREQALIEEARWRARRRRRRNVAVVLLALTAGAALGLGPAVGDQVGEQLADGPSVLGVSSRAANGQIAVADGSGTLQVVNPDGTGLHARADCPIEAEGCGIFQPAWSPDGTRLAFVRGRRYRPFAQEFAMSVYVTSAAGGARKLAACGTCAEQFGNRLDWSPDGAELVFSRHAPDAPPPQSELWIVDSDSGQLRRLTDCGSCTDLQPDWSPNGESIVFSRGGGLYTVRADGTRLTRLGTPAGTHPLWHPVWSPDGQRIAFDGRDSIYVADADGSHSKLILDGSGVPGSGPGHPAWSPDGKKLAFGYTPGVPGAYAAELWTINANGSQKQVVAASSCCVGVWAPPVWSPDGTQIAFAADSAGGTFVVNANRTGLHKVSAAARPCTRMATEALTQSMTARAKRSARGGARLEPR